MPSSIHRNKLSMFMNKRTTQLKKVKRRAKHNYKKTKRSTIRRNNTKNNFKVKSRNVKKNTISLRKSKKKY